jgi:hypothetical protein
MIHEIGLEIDALLKARGCPMPVIDGPESDPTTFANDRIVIETAGGDAWIPVERVSHNPKRYAIRRIGVQIRIFAHVERKGAAFFEHRRKCDHVLDLVYVALRKVAQTRGNAFEIRTADYYLPPDLAASDSPAGCGYELRLFWDRAVGDIDWQYRKADEATITDVETTFNITS